MLMGEDFNLSSVQRYNDSFVEILKRTILEHEAIFRMQVYELHRLYKIQKILMEDLNLKDLKGRTSWEASRPSILMPLQDHPKHKQLNGGEFSPALPMVSPQTANQGTCPKLKPRPLDLQLSADDYISHFGADLSKQSKQGDSWEALKQSVEVGRFPVTKQFSDPVEVKLSLSAGKDTRNQQRNSRCTSLSIPDVIDLEGPVVGSTSLGTGKPSSCNYSEEPSAHNVDRSGVEVCVPCDPSIPGNMKENSGHWIFRKCFLKDNKRPEQTFSPGTSDHFGGSPPSNHHVKKSSSSWNMELLDLNIVRLEESSCFSNAPLVTFPSPATSSSGVHGLTDESLKGTNAVSNSTKPNSTISDGTSDLLQPDNAAAFSTSTYAGEKDYGMQASCRSSMSKGNNGSKLIVIDLELLPEDQVEVSEDLVDQSSEPRENNLDFSPEGQSVHIHPPDKIDVVAQTVNDGEIGQESCEKSEEDTVSSSSPCQSHVIQGECLLDSPATDGPNQVDSSQREKVLQFGKDCKHESTDSYHPVLEDCGADRIQCQVAETHSSRHDLIVIAADCPCGIKDKSCNCTKTKHQDSNELQQETQESDQLVSQAAESLLHISLSGSNHPQNWIPEGMGSGNLTNRKTDEPQCSSESFESIMLRVENASMDDYCVTSAVSEVKETETEIKGCGVSLRRGRRLKDFQKDVLPSLVSLSRLEICEDIHSIGGSIKSNEYRKGRSKKAGTAQNWFEPMRSRRSRFNYVC